MSIYREFFTKLLTPVNILVFISISAIFTLTACHENMAKRSVDTRTNTVQAPQQDRNSLSGELSLLRSSSVIPRNQEEATPRQYTSLSDPYLEAERPPYLNEEKSFEEDEETLINPKVAARGLNGTLSTRNAGQSLLKETGYSSKSSAVASTSSKYYRDDAPSTSKRLKSANGLTTNLLTTAYSLTGRPYLDGGMTPENGFDDIGFVSYVYSSVGASIFPKNAKSILSSGTSVSKESLRPGDILVYRNPRNESQYLLGIYTGNGNFLLSSSRLKFVSETAAFGIDYGPYFVGGRRYFEDASAAPLSDSMKMAATNGAVKQALASMGNIPKASYKAPVKKKTSKRNVKSKSKQTSGRSKSSKRR
ncbi:MAG: C40 family peptidase [Deltaproteobacteria bacterium]|jgi:cell wall-associated NlpC family hydrolase|nr:C40 family peptidase [Deltaproteobacteria bacterium]